MLTGTVPGSPPSPLRQQTSLEHEIQRAKIYSVLRYSSYEHYHPAHISAFRAGSPRYDLPFLSVAGTSEESQALLLWHSYWICGGDGAFLRVALFGVSKLAVLISVLWHVGMSVYRKYDFKVRAPPLLDGRSLDRRPFRINGMSFALSLSNSRNWSASSEKLASCAGLSMVAC